MEKTLKIKLTLWAAASAFLAVLTAVEGWPAFKANLSHGYTAFVYHLAPWGVLVLCVLWLYLKRRQIMAAVAGPVTVAFTAAGLGIIALTRFIPAAPDFLLLKAIAVSLGVYTALFGRGALIPLAIFSTYAFTLLFPLFVEACLETSYALSTVVPVNWLANLTGLGVTTSGQMFSLTTPAGGRMTVLVSGACAGPATMAVFIAIFTLMMLDVPAPRNRALLLFLFGVLGTWLQNVLRIMIILACGRLIGEKALWAAHFYTIYVLFPLWYLVFAAVYFKAASGRGHEGLPAKTVAP